MGKQVELKKSEIVANIAKELNLNSNDSQEKMERIVQDSVPDKIGSFEEGLLIMHKEMVDQLTPEQLGLEYMKAFLTIGELNRRVKHLETVMAMGSMLRKLASRN